MICEPWYKNLDSVYLTLNDLSTSLNHDEILLQYFQFEKCPTEILNKWFHLGNGLLGKFSLLIRGQASTLNKSKIDTLESTIYHPILKIKPAGFLNHPNSFQSQSILIIRSKNNNKTTKYLNGRFQNQIRFSFGIDGKRLQLRRGICLNGGFSITSYSQTLYDFVLYIMYSLAVLRKEIMKYPELHCYFTGPLPNDDLIIQKYEESRLVIFRNPTQQTYQNIKDNLVYNDSIQLYKYENTNFCSYKRAEMFAMRMTLTCLMHHYNVHTNHELLKYTSIKNATYNIDVQICKKRNFLQTNSPNDITKGIILREKKRHKRIHCIVSNDSDKLKVSTTIKSCSQESRSLAFMKG